MLSDVVFYMDSKDISTTISPSLNYLTSLNKSYSPFLKHRRVLVDWMCEVCDKLKISSSASHRSVGILDQYMSKGNLAKVVTKSQLQLIAVSCILMGSKFEEVKIPKIDVLLRSIKFNCPIKDVVRMEQLILQTIDWNLSFSMPTDYVSIYSQGFIHLNELLDNGRFATGVTVEHCQKFNEFFCDLCLQELNFYKYESKIIAASILALSRANVKLREVWPDNLAHLTECSFLDIQPCFEEI